MRSYRILLRQTKRELRIMATLSQATPKHWTYSHDMLAPSAKAALAMFQLALSAPGSTRPDNE